MADGDIKIKDLSEALQIDNNAEFVYTQDNGGTNTTFKATVNQIARKIAESVTYTNLETTSKTLVGAINELSHLGNPILLGTTAPTSSQGANGNIYVQYTEGTGGSPDTVDSIYAKIDGAWCEIETGGGSGSGGHTIVDNEGVSLEQRTNLQFNGAYSEDNSTDDTTEVNVVREMTKAEFDLLSADEKVGFINITDITGGNDDRFQPVIYSEDEREIGVWVDGKPLYQKTLVIAGTSLTAGGTNRINHGISNVDYIQLVNGTYTFGEGGDKLPLPFADNYKPVTDSVVVIEAINSGNIRIGVGSNYSGNVSPNTVWVTVQYTKTTDQAGSGQWTPQGVPAHHYSTDEQIIGTWIDGSTLYEKTVDIAQYSVTAEDTQFKDLVTIANIDFLVSAEIHKIPPNVGQVLRFNVSNDYIQVASKTTINLSAFGNLPVTFRYTKSST